MLLFKTVEQIWNRVGEGLFGSGDAQEAREVESCTEVER